MLSEIYPQVFYLLIPVICELPPAQTRFQSLDARYGHFGVRFAVGGGGFVCGEQYGRGHDDDFLRDEQLLQHLHWVCYECVEQHVSY